MENEQPALFSFSIDEMGKTHLISIAKWNRFMAIVGIVISFLVILVMIFGGSVLFSTLSRLGSGNAEASPPALTGVYLAGLIFFYIVCIAIYLIPCFFRLSFSNKMLKAIANTDQEMLNDSLNQLKIYSKYWGILTIIGIALYALLFIVVIIGLLAGTMR